MPSGGYRQPTNPAPVSGIGGGSARTDGGVMNPNSPQYGDGATLESLKAGAPVAGGMLPVTPQAALAGAPNGMLAGLTGLGDPSAHPDMPVTAGAPSGAGPGIDALGLPQTPRQQQTADAANISPGVLSQMIRRSQSPNASPSFKRLLREVLASR